MVPEPRNIYALKFFGLAVGVLSTGLLVAVLLGRLFPVSSQTRPNHFSIAFVFSSALLAIGSACLFNAVHAVRREHQMRFRNSLVCALVTGTLFVAVQTYALSCLVRQQPAGDAANSAVMFVAVCAFLHGMHFVIALLFLTHVTIQAFADRYDHEYHWGVIFCAWFWHALGIIWVAILFVMMITRFTSADFAHAFDVLPNGKCDQTSTSNLPAYWNFKISTCDHRNLP